MKILISGANGFIGKRLGVELVRRGHTIVALSRSHKEMELPFPCETLEWDPTDVQTPVPLSGIDAIVHLAGEPINARWSASQKEKILRSRIDSTDKLVHSIEVSKKNPSSVHVLKTFVCASAVGYYGGEPGSPQDIPKSELDRAGSDFLSNVCVEWESHAARAISSGVRTISIRTGVVLGLDGGVLAQVLPVFRNHAGGVLGSGEQQMSWIHIEDIVAIYVFALENSKLESGPINAVAPHPVTNRQFTQTLGELTHRAAALRVPAFALKIALGEMSSIALEGIKASSEKIQKAGFQFHFPDLQPALNDLILQTSDPQTGELVECLQATQWVPRPISEIFPFFAAAENLEKLTPPFLGFSILKKSTPQIQKDTLIDYRIKLYGAPLRWQTLITEWVPGKRFVDLQLKGPYALWHHTHEFESMAGGTLLTDLVRFKMPAGPLGELAAGWKVHGDLKKIFSYRRKVVSELFSQSSRP